jgi:hypothetical protein
MERNSRVISAPGEKTICRVGRKAEYGVGLLVSGKTIAVLNAAGRRLSGWPEGHGFALAVEGGVIRQVRTAT